MITKNQNLTNENNDDKKECEFCTHEAVATCNRCDAPMCKSCIGGNSAVGIVCWDCYDDLNG